MNEQYLHVQVVTVVLMIAAQKGTMIYDEDDVPFSEKYLDMTVDQGFAVFDPTGNFLLLTEKGKSFVEYILSTKIETKEIYIFKPV